MEAVVIGAGAIGIVLADALAVAGLGVAVLGGRPIDRIVVEDGGDVRTHPVQHLPEWDGWPRSGPVVVAVKAQHTAHVGPLIAAAAPSASAVVVAQNGIEQGERVAPFTGSTPVVPLLVYTPAVRTAPGRATLIRPAAPDVVLADDAGARQVGDLLTAGGLRVEHVEDLRTAAWRKLLLNLASMTFTTLTGRPVAVLREPAVAAAALALVTEAAAVARAGGAAIGPEEPAAILARLQGLPDGSTTSMLTDRREGRGLEDDAIHGAAVRAADRAGLPAPLLRQAAALVASVR